MCDCDCELPKRERWKLVRDEALREAAEKVRGPWRVGEFSEDERAAILQAADLIDPDKDN